MSENFGGNLSKRKSFSADYDELSDVVVDKPDSLDHFLTLAQADLPYPSSIDPSLLSESFKSFYKRIEDLHSAICSRNEAKVKEIINKNKNLKYFFNMSNVTAASTALYANAFDIYEILLTNDINLAPHEFDSFESLSDEEKLLIQEIHKKHSKPLLQKHLSELMAISYGNTTNAQKNLNIVFEFYKELGQNFRLDAILKGMTRSKNVQIIYDFEENCPEGLEFGDMKDDGDSEDDVDDRSESSQSTDSKDAKNSKIMKIFIPAKDFLNESTKNTATSILIHKLFKHVINLTYKNSGNPYTAKDEKNIEILTEICENYANNQAGNHPTIQQILDIFPPPLLHAELINSIPQIVLSNLTQPEKFEQIRNSNLKIFEYYEDKVVPEMIYGIDVASKKKKKPDKEEKDKKDKKQKSEKGEDTEASVKISKNLPSQDIPGPIQPHITLENLTSQEANNPIFEMGKQIVDAVAALEPTITGVLNVVGMISVITIVAFSVSSSQNLADYLSEKAVTENLPLIVDPPDLKPDTTTAESPEFPFNTEDVKEQDTSTFRGVVTSFTSEDVELTTKKDWNVENSPLSHTSKLDATTTEENIQPDTSTIKQTEEMSTIQELVDPEIHTTAENMNIDPQTTQNSIEVHSTTTEEPTEYISTTTKEPFDDPTTSDSYMIETTTQEDTATNLETTDVGTYHTITEITDISTTNPSIVIETHPTTESLELDATTTLESTVMDPTTTEVEVNLEEFSSFASKEQITTSEQPEETITPTTMKHTIPLTTVTEVNQEVVTQIIPNDSITLSALEVQNQLKDFSTVMTTTSAKPDRKTYTRSLAQKGYIRRTAGDLKAEKFTKPYRSSNRLSRRLFSRRARKSFGLTTKKSLIIRNRTNSRNIPTRSSRKAITRVSKMTRATNVRRANRIIIGTRTTMQTIASTPKLRRTRTRTATKTEFSSTEQTTQHVTISSETFTIGNSRDESKDDNQLSTTDNPTTEQMTSSTSTEPSLLTSSITASSTHPTTAVISTRGRHRSQPKTTMASIIEHQTTSTANGLNTATPGWITQLEKPTTTRSTIMSTTEWLIQPKDTTTTKNYTSTSKKPDKLNTDSSRKSTVPVTEKSTSTNVQKGSLATAEPSAQPKVSMTSQTTKETTPTSVRTTTAGPSILEYHFTRFKSNLKIKNLNDQTRDISTAILKPTEATTRTTTSIEQENRPISTKSDELSKNKAETSMGEEITKLTLEQTLKPHKSTTEKTSTSDFKTQDSTTEKNVKNSSSKIIAHSKNQTIGKVTNEGYVTSKLPENIVTKQQKEPKIATSRQDLKVNTSESIDKTKTSTTTEVASLATSKSDEHAYKWTSSVEASTTSPEISTLDQKFTKSTTNSILVHQIDFPTSKRANLQERSKTVWLTHSGHPITKPIIQEAIPFILKFYFAPFQPSFKGTKSDGKVKEIVDFVIVKSKYSAASGDQRGHFGSEKSNKLSNGPKMYTVE